ncbi:hypothetical protein BS47DRAFT_1397605 [Hydnum rufescens UP504]|uniref:Uncharacterized protein n=1 Tax=Hydnum rufescens UP504 TaxID=1448309 RepID=A0A9P6DN81_9AGAM|nr:hypothetical protein BS47DRAFT_1397605 [Hydnum rufescens UP504]
MQKMLASRQRRTCQPREEENHRPTEEDHRPIGRGEPSTYGRGELPVYGLRGIVRPVEEENHSDQQKRKTIGLFEEENRSQTRMLPNVSEVGDDENDHNDDSADKAADELTKMAWMIMPWLTPKSHHKVHGSPPHHDLLLQPDVISPGSPSEDIFVQGSKSHPPSPSAPYSHQSLSPNQNSWCFCGTFKEPSGPSGRHSSSHECSEHGSHDLQPALTTSLLALMTSLLTLMISIPTLVTTLLTLGPSPMLS